MRKRRSLIEIAPSDHQSANLRRQRQDVLHAFDRASIKLTSLAPASTYGRRTRDFLLESPRGDRARTRFSGELVDRMHIRSDRWAGAARAASIPAVNTQQKKQSTRAGQKKKKKQENPGPRQA